MGGCARPPGRCPIISGKEVSRQAYQDTRKDFLKAAGGHVINQAGADLRPDNAAEAQGKADFIIDVGQFAVRRQGRDGNDQDGQERSAHGLLGRVAHEQQQRHHEEAAPQAGE